MRPTLALLVPAYNASGYLPRLLGSAVAQTPAFDEIWVYDDASSDDTAVVAARYGAKVVRGERNLGCSGGKNEAAKRTSCDWLHFHDADDELKPGFVAKCHEWMAKDQHDVVIFAYDERNDDTGEFITTNIHDPQRLAADPLAYVLEFQIAAICGLYRRSAFEAAGGWDVDPAVLYNEDVAFHLRLALTGVRWAGDPEPLVINHRRLNSMSQANRAKCLAAQGEVMRKAAEAAPARYHHLIARRLWQVAGGAASVPDWPTADAAALLAARLAPPEPGLFRMLARLSPRFALRLRETTIRLLKPELRREEAGI